MQRKMALLAVRSSIEGLAIGLMIDLVIHRD